MAALVEVPPVAALLLLAEAPVLVLDPRPEAERADPAGRLVLQVVPVLRHVLVESPGQEFYIDQGRMKQSTLQS